MSEKIIQTAGREQLGEFAPMFAHLNDDVLFGEVWNESAISVKTKCIITVVSLVDMADKAGDWAGQNTYYDITCAEWDEAYKEIPEKSTIIWNDIDYRSSWYRPDVYNGELFEGDTWDSLSERYYASDYVVTEFSVKDD